MSDYDHLAQLYKRVTWIGIFLNMLFVVPLLFAPRFALDILQLNVEPLIWARIPGLLLFTISVFYIPASFDLKRYRAHAWIAIAPSRAGGALFFFGAVFIFGFPWGFLPIAIIDFVILLIQLIILLKIRKIERAEGS